jgi:hypothetical protein
LRERIETHAALMRCQNSEAIRRQLWKKLGRELVAGKVTAREAIAIKNDFWDALRQDQSIARRANAAPSRKSNEPPEERQTQIKTKKAIKL